MANKEMSNKDTMASKDEIVEVMALILCIGGLTILCD